MSLQSCSDGAAPLATLTHDLEGGATLRAYRAEPAAENRQMDMVHERMYGFKTLSPRTPYICVWRDPKRFRATAADGPPVQIFMICSFGTEDWEPPREVMREAEERMFRAEALLRADWLREGDTYRLTRIELQAKTPGSNSGFRSANAGDDLSAIRVRDWEVTFPQSVEEGLRFRMEVTAPYRLNSGEPAKEPSGTFRIEGEALPIPDWVMY